MMLEHNKEKDSVAPNDQTQGVHDTGTSVDPLAAYSIGFSTWWRIGAVFLCTAAVILWVVLVFEGAIPDPFTWILTL